MKKSQEHAESGVGSNPYAPKDGSIDIGGPGGIGPVKVIHRTGDNFETVSVSLAPNSVIALERAVAKSSLIVVMTIELIDIVLSHLRTLSFSDKSKNLGDILYNLGTFLRCTPNPKPPLLWAYQLMSVELWLEEPRRILGYNSRFRPSHENFIRAMKELKESDGKFRTLYAPEDK
jgi:hypothetical protein